MMRACLLPLIASLLIHNPPGLFASDALVEAALAAEARFDSKAALGLFREAEKNRPNDAFVLQKIARQLSDSASDTSDRERQKALITESLSYAERAVQLEPNNPVNVISVAICQGKLATYADTGQKIAYSKMVKEGAERALALDPNYDWGHHLLGRWHYEVASIGGAKRWFARLIYSELPPASFETAITSLKRAVELSPQSVAHTLELGFAYRASGQKAEAIAAFKKGLALPVREKHDVSAKTRAQAALAELER